MSQPQSGKEAEVAEKTYMLLCSLCTFASWRQMALDMFVAITDFRSLPRK